MLLTPFEYDDLRQTGGVKDALRLRRRAAHTKIAAAARAGAVQMQYDRKT